MHSLCFVVIQNLLQFGDKQSKNSAANKRTKFYTYIYAQFISQTNCVCEINSTKIKELCSLHSKLNLSTVFDALVMSPDSEGLGAAIEAGVGLNLTRTCCVS